MSGPAEVTRERALAFRLAAHHLHKRLPSTRVAEAASCGLQDTPPGGAAHALAQRLNGATPETLEQLVIIPSLRGAPFAVAPADLAVFTAPLTPPDEDAARELVGSATDSLDREGVAASDALAEVSAAVKDAVGGGPLERDAFHQALRERLPKRLLWWCRGCGSHHVHPSLWRATGGQGALAIVGRDGRTAIFGAPPPVPAFTDPGAELVRRYLRHYGPASPAGFAGWAGISKGHAQGLWGAVEDELAGVALEGREAWILAQDRPRLGRPPKAGGVRLLANLDPWLGQRDHATLYPDPALRKAVRRPIGGPGVVLVDGVIAGLWRATKKGRRLELAVEPVTAAAKRSEDAIVAEAERLAPLRGAETATVKVG